jgi:uncharacterized protein YggE
MSRQLSLFLCSVMATSILLAGSSALALSATQETGIRVEGFASTVIPATVVEVVFELPINSSSFEESLGTAQAIRQTFVGSLTNASLDHVDVQIDPSSFRQKAISWRKGKKIEHRFSVKASHIEPGELLATTARLMDIVLPIDPGLTVISLHSTAEEDAILSAYSKATAKAIHDAQERAAFLAREAGVKLGPLQYLTPTRTPNSGPIFDQMNEFVVLGANFREPFSVSADLDADIEVATAIVALYSIAP